LVKSKWFHGHASIDVYLLIVVLRLYASCRVRTPNFILRFQDEILMALSSWWFLSEHVSPHMPKEFVSKSFCRIGPRDTSSLRVCINARIAWRFWIVNDLWLEALTGDEWAGGPSFPLTTFSTGADDIIAVTMANHG
jgi:hypothetical protein